MVCNSSYPEVADVDSRVDIELLTVVADVHDADKTAMQFWLIKYFLLAAVTTDNKCGYYLTHYYSNYLANFFWYYGY